MHDVAVTGEIRREGERAVADLRVGRHDLKLSWLPFRAEDATVVIGALDGRGFAARVPAS